MKALGTTRANNPARTLGSRLVGPVLAVLVLAIGFTATLFVAAGLRRSDRDSAAQLMDQRTALAKAAVSTETSRYLDLLRTVAAGVGGDERMSAARFRAASAPLIDARLSGATSVVFAVPVARTSVAAAQRLWRTRGEPGLVLNPRGRPDEHVFSVFSRQLASSSPPGIDITASAEATAALNEARRTGAPAVSDTYILLRDRGLPVDHQQHSFAFAAPVYGGATGAAPVFRGWIVMGLHGQDFVGAVLRDVSQGALDVQLRATNGDGRQMRVASYAASGTKNLHRQVTFRVANRQWWLVLNADSARLRGAGGALPNTVLLGGGLLTVLLAGLVQVLATGRDRARSRVLVATAELRVAEAEARRQAGLLGAVMASIGDGVGVIDASGAFLLHNPAARELLGVGEDIDGPDDWQEHYGLYRPDGRTPFPADELPLVRALHGESCNAVEMVVRNRNRPDGILLSVDGRPLDSSAGQHGAVAVFHDVTELRRYEADLSAFAGVAAHDLKAPLAVIRGHCETAADALADEPQTPGTAQTTASLERISAVVDRMAALIDTLLAYTTSRDAPLRLEQVPLGPLVHDVVAGRTADPRLQDASAPDIYVGPLPRVTADPAMLRHVLDNLIGNALKYVAPGQVPRIDITAGPGGPGWTRVEIADRGIGIPDADKPDIFESFHRAHPAAGYAGTGLGLAICRRVVERYGGSIGVSDNPGGGTRFQFTVPVSQPSPDEPVPDELASDQAASDQAALGRALAERAAVQDAAVQDAVVHEAVVPESVVPESVVHEAVVAGHGAVQPGPAGAITAGAATPAPPAGANQLRDTPLRPAVPPAPR